MTQYINPQELIEKYTLNEHLEFANKYFDDREDHIYLYQKPFHNSIDSTSLLSNLGQLLNGANLHPGMKVLDFASGSCWLSKILVEFGCIVTSCDASSKALSIGKELFKKYPPINKNTEYPTFKVFNGKRLEEKDEIFNRIIVNDAFHHIPNTEDILKEFYRLLKPGGIVAMSEPGRYHSQTDASQFEMKNYKVIENDFILENIWKQAQLVGFNGIKVTPILRNTLITIDEYMELISGNISEKISLGLKQDSVNHSIFFLYKDINVTEDNFDEIKYLELNPDVAQAVQQGIIESGWHHYLAQGKTEGRQAKIKKAI